MNTKKLSKKILSVTTLFLLINATSVQLTHPATVKETFKKAGRAIKGAVAQKLPEIVGKARSKVKSSAAAAYNKVKNLNANEIIKRLLANTDKLGRQIGTIKDCMLSGKECSSAERAAFYATAIAIVALTAALVGFTITIAATSKEPDRELAAAVEKTSQEAKGWSPEAVFQRLANTRVQFEQKLKSMKTCLSKRQCTRAQKKSLYATAGTISALATIAIGVGIGSYIYAEYKKKQEVPPTEKKVEEKKEAISEPGAPISDADLKTLAVDQGAKTPEPPKTYKARFRAFMQKAVPIKKEGKTTVQEAAQAVRKALKEKAAYAQEALGTTGDRLKRSELAQKAKASLKKAQKVANDFIQNVQKIDIVTTIKAVLHIDLSKLRDAIKKIMNSSTEVMKPIDKLSQATLFDQINELMERIDDWQKLGADISENITAALTEWGQRGTHTTRLGKWWWGDPEDEQYPLASKLDKLLMAYPELVTRINKLDLAAPGKQANLALRETASLLEEATKIEIPLNGREIQFFTPKVRQALSTLSNNLTKMAGLIGSTTILGTGKLIKAPVDTEQVASTKETVKQFLSSFIWNLDPRIYTNALANIPKLTADLSDNAAAIQPEIEVLNEALDRMNNSLYEMPKEIRKKYTAQLLAGENKLQNVAHAGELLRNAMGEQIQVVKGNLDAALQIGNSMIQKVGKVLQASAELFNTINQLMSSGQRAYINEDVERGFNQIADVIKSMESTLLQLGTDIKEFQIPVIQEAG